VLTMLLKKLFINQEVLNYEDSSFK
jgi:hypothetical protein